jgi:3-oxoacyl-[acyl-carrier protein] reductase
VTDAAAAHAALEALLDAGPVQILVNNAGVHDDAAFPGMREAQWRSVIDVSLHGFFHVTQPLVLPMLRTRWGRIVNMASVSAVAGNRGQVNYAAAKGALISATRALALELGRRGVTVNAVAPGLIDTAMSQAFPEDRLRALVPLQRAGTAAEVADLVGFLASDRAAYITGQTIPINGGML